MGKVTCCIFFKKFKKGGKMSSNITVEVRKITEFMTHHNNMPDDYVAYVADAIELANTL